MAIQDEKSAALWLGLVGLATGVLMAMALNLTGPGDLGPLLVVAISGLAFGIALRAVLGLPWVSTVVMAVLMLVATFSFNFLTRAALRSDNFLDDIYYWMTIPVWLLLGGWALYHSMRTWTPFAIVLGPYAVASVVNLMLIYGELMPWNLGYCLPMATLFAMMGHVLADEAG